MSTKSSLAFTAGFSSNLYFWKNVNYFANNAHVEPLLHTWSLAVEEQFYIFYPLALVFLLRRKISAAAAIAALLVTSFAICVFTTRLFPGAAFYLLPTRAWELMIGALLALGWPKPARTLRQAEIGGGVGLLLIAYAIILYQPDTPFPGVAAAVPTVGAALVIWAGMGKVAHATRLLSAKPFVEIGKASYSFYLWHYPLFAFAAYLFGGKLTPGMGIVLAACALGLSFLTLWLLENPVRLSKRRAAVFAPLTAMALVLFASVAMIQSDGFPGRLSPQMRIIASTANDKFRHPFHCMSSGDVTVRPEDACLLGDATAEPHTLLWGDSHAAVTATSMTGAARQAGESFLFAATADCPPGLGFAIDPRFVPTLSTTPSYRFCDDYNRQMLRRAMSPTIDTVVISSRWSNWRIDEPANAAESSVDLRLQDLSGGPASRQSNRTIFERGFSRLLEELTNAGKCVVLVGPVPEPQFDVPNRLYIAEFRLVDEAVPLTRSDYARRHADALDILQKADRASDSVELVQPVEILCRDIVCPLIENGTPIYFDHNHLSVYGARKLTPLFKGVFSE